MLLETRNLDKDYSLGKTTIAALRGVNLSIDQGEFVSIMGPSGCGKTTLLNILGCIDRPTRGQVLFGGTDVAGLSDDQETDKRLGEIGFIFQSFNLYRCSLRRRTLNCPWCWPACPRPGAGPGWTA